MKENMTVHQSGLHLPVSRAFIKIITEYLPPPPLIPPAVTPVSYTNLTLPTILRV